MGSEMCIRDRNIIAEAIQDGYKGAVKVLWDSGADETKQKDETRQTLPRWLFKDTQVVSRKRPDIVMLPRFRARVDDVSKLQWVDPRSMYESQRKVLIVEVSYTQLSGMRKREQDKRSKYQVLLQELEDNGWLPKLCVIILGTLGEIPASVHAEVMQLGVGKSEIVRMKQKLHDNAIQWMDKLIDRENELNGWEVNECKVDQGT